MRDISVIIAIAQSILRVGMRRILESHNDIAVIGEAHEGSRVLEMAMMLQPSVLVMDSAIHQFHTMEIARRVREHNPETRIIAISYRRECLIMDPGIDSPIGGHVLNDYADDDIADVIRLAHNGNWNHPGGITKQHHGVRWHQDRMIRDRSHVNRVSDLTPREVEVLHSIADGNANKQTAVKLAISQKTVEKHREHLMKKLGVRNAAGLTRYAIDAGISDLQALYVH